MQDAVRTVKIIETRVEPGEDRAIVILLIDRMGEPVEIIRAEMAPKVALRLKGQLKGIEGKID